MNFVSGFFAGQFKLLWRMTFKKTRVAEVGIKMIGKDRNVD